MPEPGHLDADASSRALHTALVERGHEVTRTPNEWMPRNASDERQLLGATAHGRCIFTFNVRDFVVLARRFPHHGGIILADRKKIAYNTFHAGLMQSEFSIPKGEFHKAESAKGSKMSTLQDHGELPWGLVAAIITAVGTLFSGPLAFLAVSSVRPQPEWSGSQVYVDNFHPIQSVTFYFGFLLVTGSVLMIAYIYHWSKDFKSLLALVFTTIAGGLISFNYFIEATFVPSLVRNYTPELDPLIRTFAVTNPSSLFWAIEMWGYGFLGLGTLFAMDFFSTGGIERLTRFLFFVNGIVSLAGALYTSIYQEWVLSTAGLISYGFWNVLYFALAVSFLFVILGRRSKVAPT